MIARLLILSCFLFLSCSLSAQLNALQRVELELPFAIKGERVLSLEENGALLSHFEQGESTNRKRWTFQAFDQDLNAQQALSFFLPKSFIQQSATYDPLTQQSHHLFVNRQKDFKLFTFQWPSGQVEEIQDAIPVGRSIQRMMVHENLIYFVSRQRGRDHLWTLHTQTREKAIIPFQHPNYPANKTRIQKMEVLEADQTVLVFAHALVDDKPNASFLGEFQNNRPKTIQAINIGRRLEAENLTAFKTGENDFLLSTSYAQHRNSKSEGIALFNLQDQKVQNIQFHSYGGMLEFFSYLPAERQERIGKRKLKKQKKGKEFIRRYEVITHPLLKVDDGYLVLGEAFYRTEDCYMIGDLMVSDFDGYQYTHAFILKVDEAGNKLWDQSFPMWPSYRPMTKKRFIQVETTVGNQIRLVYANRNQLESKVLDKNGQVLDDKRITPLRGQYNDDEIRRTLSYLSYWHDDHFLSHGFQRIVNTNLAPGERRRRVYYLEKWQFKAEDYLKETDSSR